MSFVCLNGFFIWLGSGIRKFRYFYFPFLLLLWGFYDFLREISSFFGKIFAVDDNGTIFVRDF